ncbi:GH20934 [Drosophila grimshawi]|uniref:GH20934 n=1 Tax=Drosophila grimshawi TaxID=7222 RepID=B4J495_DROGR|nr:GH20934 [Drosophila grimshawi]
MDMKDNNTLEAELQDALSESCKNSSIDVYLHFFWIFACIYALAKLTELSERYVNAKIASKERSSELHGINDEWEKTLKLYEQDKIELDSQLQSLRERNCGLEASMRDLRDCNLQLISENYMRTVLQDQQIQGLAQRVQDQQSASASNIYITNRHIHLTRQVFLNEGHSDLDLDLDANLGDRNLNSLNVWVQYLKMRKCYMGKLADPKLVLNGQPERILPIVMTTEQMARLQGISTA